MPRRNRSSPENNANLNLTYEKTLGTVGGIRAEASLEADLGDVLGLKANRLNGSFDAGDRTASINAGLGSKATRSGASVEGTVKLGEDGRIESIGGSISGRILGFGGGLSADSQGNAAISGEAFGGKVEISRDSAGNFSIQVCYGFGPLEACTTFARDQGDPQNEGSLKLGGGIKPGTGSRRPNSPNLPPRQPIRRPPARSRSQPERPPRPQSERPVKPHQDKKPTPPKKPTPKPRADIRKKPVEPVPSKKKPQIDLKKKPQINLEKPKADIRKKTPKPSLKPKKPSPKPQPINLKKPVTPSPNPTKPPRPKSTPKPPKTPRPTPSPQLPKPAPVPRPSPWPRTEPTPAPVPVSKPVTEINCSNGSQIKLQFSTRNGTGTINDWLTETTQDFASLFRNPNAYNSAQLLDPQKTDLYYADYKLGKGKWISEVINYYSFVYSSKRQENDPYYEFLRNGFWWIDNQKTGTEVLRVKYSFERVKYWNPSYPQEMYVFYGTPYSFKVTPLDALPPPSCPSGSTPILPPLVAPPSAPKYYPPRLPNQPTKVKPMDCCKKVDEIYKYLGIAKLKKNKFPVAKQFLSPGGTGNEDCEDYYQLNQALFRMLANGLILNPKASPHGNLWQSVNATAWAGDVYEMVAEAMSNGDSTQKFEISMIMQTTQLLQIIAEQTRKIEFLSECLGIEPDLDVEEIPACFTVYEGHKGFDPNKKPEKIDVTKAKTDSQVEETLAKMLQPSKVPIVKWVFKPESKSIVRILRDE
ncbi:MAG: hypothetical protein ACM65M_10575 [Microcoleus sp.]